MSWNAGIAEVALPIEYKIRNIEETEAAKQQLENEKKNGNLKASQYSSGVGASTYLILS